MEEEMICLKCKETEEVNRQLKKIIALIKSDLALSDQKLTEFIENAQRLEKRLDSTNFPFGPIPHWIKCSERLPEEGQTVICYNGMIFMGFYQVEHCPYEKSKQGWNIDFAEYEDGIFREREVTHWMPLPEPPNV